MRIGSLCTGIAGLELGLQYAGIETKPVFVSDIDPGACDWLEQAMPHTPNLGDFTELDELPEVDIITAGFPCQPVSTAGLRKGINDERWLFDDICRLVSRMDSRPVLFLENVSGIFTANGGHALGRVVYGLADIGYHISWGTLPASAVGSPHRRLRWWGLAFHADSVAGSTAGERTDRTGRKPEVYGTNTGLVRDVADALGAGQQQSWTQTDQTGRGRSAGRSGGVAADADSVAAGRNSGATLSSEEQGRRQPQDGDRSRDGGRAAAADTDSDGSKLVRRLNLVERDADGRNGEGPRSRAAVFGGYWPAVARWEHILGRPAPDPTVAGRLNPGFVEWMMGYPEGWVTDIMTRRTHSLKALGNSVVPQCAAEAFLQLSTR